MSITSSRLIGVAACISDRQELQYTSYKNMYVASLDFASLLLQRSSSGILGCSAAECPSQERVAIYPYCSLTCRSQQPAERPGKQTEAAAAPGRGGGKKGTDWTVDSRRIGSRDGSQDHSSHPHSSYHSLVVKP